MTSADVMGVHRGDINDLGVTDWMIIPQTLPCYMGPFATTAWRALSGCGWRDTLPQRRGAANILNKQPWTNDNNASP
jgi:hypothetical protein